MDRLYRPVSKMMPVIFSLVDKHCTQIIRAYIKGIIIVLSYTSPSRNVNGF